MHMQYEFPFTDVIEEFREVGVDVEISCVVNEKGIHTSEDIERYLSWAKGLGITKVLFRRMYGSEPDLSMVTSIADSYQDIWDRTVYEFNGIAVRIGPTKSITDEHFVFAPDNHLYSSWLHKTAIIM